LELNHWNSYYGSLEISDGKRLKRTLSKNDIEDLIVGATLLGVGGGGDPQKGLEILLEASNHGKELVIASMEEFASKDVLASPYFVGSVAPAQPKKPMPKIIDDPIETAFELLEAKLGQKISGTVPSEIGGGNTAASLAVAAKLGIPMLDGDLIGRAGPELHQSTVHIFGIPMVPSAIVSESGNEFLIEKYAGIDDYEAIARYASVISGGHVAVVDTPLSIAKAKECVVHGTISKCIAIGRSRREAVVQGKDPIEAILENLTNGKRIFEGIVSEYTWKDERGFLYGEAFLAGSQKYSGRTLKSWIMNEHIMCWIDGQPAVMPPDLIMFVDPASGLGITNDKLKKGTQVIVLGSSIDPVWRKEKGLELFGPKRFGLAYDYVPFEKLFGDLRK
jgi:DUF917 family protein